jgi:NAD(P)-dependent dehydrogenase (short-subunit alcohol dehydrogenase family)
VSLAGRTALVTGASRGIGRAIAVALAAEGVRVALSGRDIAALEETRAQAGGVVLPADVTDPAAVAALVDDAIGELGHLDIVVNNAGGNSFSVPFHTMRPDGWDKVLRLNLDSVAAVCRAVAPHLLGRGSGSVINVASVAAISAMPGMAHYAAAKAAVLALTRTLAVEWAPHGVRCNALVPGWVATDLTGFAREDPAVGRRLIARVPMGRWATPDEIAGPAVFLASDAASFVTGHSLVVDGGLTVG